MRRPARTAETGAFALVDALAHIGRPDGVPQLAPTGSVSAFAGVLVSRSVQNASSPHSPALADWLIVVAFVVPPVALPAAHNAAMPGLPHFGAGNESSARLAAAISAIPSIT
jgi:hypothetical protein